MHTHKEEEEEKQTLQDMIIHLKGHRIQLIFYADWNRAIGKAVFGINED